MNPATRSLDIWVAFLPGGHRSENYYPQIGIDAANAWYGAVHNVILWKTPDGRSQIAVRGTPFGASGWSGVTSKGSSGKVGYSCSKGGKFTDDTWVQWNTSYTNGYSDDRNRAVAVHELGHALGLGHESRLGVCGSIMHPTVNSCTWRPTWDDVLGIQELYPGRA